MKSINKYISIAAMGMLGLTSCNDFLETTSPSQQDPTFVYSNTDDASNALNGVYVLFCEDPFTSRMSCVWMQNTDVEQYNPNAGRPNGAHRSDIWGLQAAADEGFADIYKAYNNCMQAVDRANQVIEGVSESSISDDSEMKQIKGEAVCLKATRYLMLCNYWGDVPYFAEAAKAGMELDRPREDKFRIYSQILQELVDVEGDMKFSDVNTGGIERMNRDYALGLIAKVALFRAGYGKTVDNQMKRADDYLDVTGDETLAVTYKDLNGNEVTARTYTDYYQLAKNYCQKLISLKPRALRADFGQIFLDENQYLVKNNDEVLYEVAFTESFGGDVGWCIGVTNTNSKKTNGNTTNQVGLTPTYYQSFNVNDSRRDVTCAWWFHDNDTIGFAKTSLALTVGKWDRCLATKELGAASSKGTGINWPLMRYSDVLLMLAEAENELNGPTALAKAQLTEVRARAFAKSPDYAHDVTAYVDSVAGSKDKFFNAIVDERAWEFGGECLRKFDLIRWNIYGEKLNSTLKALRAWGISTDADLMSDPAFLAQYPEALDYTGWADVVYYDINNAGSTNSKDDITVHNPKYRVSVDEADENGWKPYASWGKALLRIITTYKYNGISYTSCVKTTNKTEGTSTYALTGGDAEPKEYTITVNEGEETGIIRVRKYQEADAVQRMYRGYTGATGYGNGPVPYLLPIGATTLSSSQVLNNDGYGFAETYVGDDVPVVYTTIEKAYK